MGVSYARRGAAGGVYAASGGGSQVGSAGQVREGVRNRVTSALALYAAVLAIDRRASSRR
jgi:hypothetical protein